MADAVKKRKAKRHSLDPDAKSGIILFLHCRQCLASMPLGVSPREWNRTESGIDAHGRFVVWCVRHDIGVARLKLDPETVTMLRNAGCAHEGA